VQADDIWVLEQLERPDLPSNLPTPGSHRMKLSVDDDGRPADWIEIRNGQSKTYMGTWSSMRRERILLRSRILMAKWPPVPMWRAYFTLPKLPSPRVRPISYLPSSDARVHSAPAGSPFTIHKRTRAGLPREVVWPTLLIRQCVCVCVALLSGIEPAS